jgi:CubicO group peptidase (beta-lactamase class C family)
MFSSIRQRDNTYTVSAAMAELESQLDALAAKTQFSGVVRVDRGEEVVLAKAYGFAHRGYEIPNQVDTRFATASAVKGLTALAVVSLIEDGSLELSTTARSLLGAELPLIGDAVTVEHLLAHRSGIGDYLDENVEMDINAYLMPVPVHELVVTEDYLAVLDGHPTKFAPDEQFAYCNGGYVVLALIAERVAGTPFHDLVHDLVCSPAGMADTAFLRSDELPGRAAVGYLQVGETWRTNVFHLPICGSGDGGIYTTAADVAAFWQALFAGAIVREETLADMLRERSAAREDRGYGLGFWLPTGGRAVRLHGGDTGVRFVTVHDPDRLVTWTLLSNTDGAAGQMVARLEEERA